MLRIPVGWPSAVAPATTAGMPLWFTDRQGAVMKHPVTAPVEKITGMPSLSCAASPDYSDPYRGTNFRNSQSRMLRGRQARSLKSQASMPTV